MLSWLSQLSLMLPPLLLHLYLQSGFRLNVVWHTTKLTSLNHASSHPQISYGTGG